VADWKSITDEIIREAMEDGKFSNLPGEGKPLNLDDDTNTPEHLRLTHKLMRDNDIAPDWIIDGQDLEAMREMLLKTLRRAGKTYRYNPNSNRTETDWYRAQRLFVETALRYNRKVLTYNLKVPPGIAHRAPLNTEREIQRALET
jgi:hypothetical protein